ncbi:MAG: DUF4198 domain-containing protein [Paracoccaceae bacterium]
MARSFLQRLGMAFVLSVTSVLSAQAHEFWLLPEDYTLEPGAPLRVDLRNGQEMNGIPLPYLPAAVTRFDMVTGDTTTPVTSRLGDMPALDTTAPDSGLLVVVHETTDSTLTYNDFAKFTRFVTHKAATDVLDEHAARSLPETGFSEQYRRYAKSLIAVGDGAGADRAMGLRIEIVALANPYTDDVSGGLPLQVLLDGQPHAGAQIELFSRAPDDTVTIAMHITDATGIAVVPAEPGFSYLADTVDIYALPNDDVTAGPVWHSDWASLTYLVP